jgi:iron complex outermembrane receptor protein
LVAFPASPVPAAEEQEEKPTGIPEVIVIGSRIPQSEFQGPVITLDRETLDRSGAATLGEAMRHLTILNVGTLTGRDPNSDALGGTGLSIRGLGVNTTLILVNGRRIPYYGYTHLGEDTFEQFFDINSIPLGAIERVEVLKDGASAIYGSDAIAGVINIVLRDNFDGLEITGYMGAANRDGAEEHGVNGIWGTEFETSNLTFMASYSNREPLPWRDREISRSADHRAQGGEDLRSTVGVRFFPEDPSAWGSVTGSGEALGAECEERSVPGKHEFEMDLWFEFLPTCMYDLNLQRADLGEERIGVSAVYSADLDQQLLWRIEANVSSSQAIGQTAPSRFTMRERDIPSMPNPEDAFYYPAASPWNPFGEDVTFYYRFDKAGPNIDEIETDSQRLLTTLEGKFRKWNWEVGALYSRANTAIRGKNYVEWNSLSRAIQGIDLSGDGVLQDSEYLNLYTPASAPNSPELIESLVEPQYRAATTEMRLIDAQISGELSKFGPNVIMFALGLEHRYEAQDNRGDMHNPLSRLPWALNTNSSRSVNSIFAELRIPFFDFLELQPAVRYEQYDDFGSQLSPRIALRWRPWSWLLFRGAWGESFKAPTLFDLNLKETFVHNALGQTDWVRCPVTGDEYDCSWLARKHESVVGTPDAQAETAETMSIGVTLQPVDGLRFEADYWRVYNDNKARYANFDAEDRADYGHEEWGIVREDPTPEDIALGIPGRIIAVQRIALPTIEQRAEGYDFELSYVYESMRAGTINVRAMWSHLLLLERNAPWLREPNRYDGKYGTPKDRGTLSVFWGNQRLGLTVSGHYVGHYDDTVDEVVNDESRAVVVPSHTEMDLQASFQATEFITITAGVQNVFDESPPFAVGGTYRGYSPALYDMRGRYTYLRLTYTR